MGSNLAIAAGPYVMTQAGSDDPWVPARRLLVALTAINVLFVFTLYRTMHALVPFFVFVDIIMVLRLVFIIRRRLGIICALFALYPLAMISEYRLAVFGGTINITSFEILALVIVAYSFFHLPQSRSSLNTAIAFIVFFLLVNMLFLPDNLALHNYFGKMRRVLVPIIFFAGIRLVSWRMTPQYVRYTLFALAVIYLVPSIIGIIQFKTGTMFMSEDLTATEFKESVASQYLLAQFIDLERLLAKGLTVYANNFSYYLGFVLIALLLFILGRGGTARWYQKPAFIGIALVVFTALLLTFSRANILFVVLSVGFFITAHILFRNLVLVAISSTLFVVSGFLLIGYLLPEQELGTLHGRFRLAAAAISGLTDVKTLFFGQSILAFKEENVMVPHNIFLGFIYDHGIFISLIYFTVIFKSVILSIRNYIRHMKAFSIEERYMAVTLITILFYMLILSGFNYYDFNNIDRTLSVFTMVLLLEALVQYVLRRQYQLNRSGYGNVGPPIRAH